MSGRPPPPPASWRGRRPRRCRLAAAAAALALLALGLLPARAQDSTEFKPVGVRFVEKRSTTFFPGNDDPVAAGRRSSAARGDPRQAVGVEALAGGLGGGPGGAFGARRGRLAGVSPLAGGNATLAAAAAAAAASPVLRRAARTTRAAAAAAAGGKRAAPAPAATSGALRSFRAINSFDQTYAIGNPNSIAYDPPDQSLAVGNGHALGSVNTATRVYDIKTGAAKSPTIDFAFLLDLPPYVGKPNQPLGCGTLTVDPTSLYDPELRRWFQVIARVDLEQASCADNGDYWLEVAVSATASPLGEWRVYSIYASSNGRDGSPLVEGCEAGCFADFPRANLDPNALVVTTNNFAFLGDEEAFVGAGVFVLDKFALARGDEQVAVAEFSVATVGGWDADAPTQSISPAYYPPRKAGASSSSRKGKKKGRGGGNKHSGKKKGGGGGGRLPAYNDPFLLLSQSLSDEYRLLRFALTGARAMKAATTQEGLDALSTLLTITATPVALPPSPPVIRPPLYPAVTPQPPDGEFPYGVFKGESRPGLLGANIPRVLSSTVGGGRHLGVFGTLAEQEGGDYYAVYLAQLDAKSGRVLRADVLSPPGEDLNFPAVAVDRAGKGAVVSVLSSESSYMSLAAHRISSGGSVGERQIALQGEGLLDSFSVYSARPRAGDYSAAVIEPETGLFWGAGEFVAQMSCGVDEWDVDATCGGTRASVANWWSGVVALKV
jgi:hypothetical protein